LRSGKGLGGGQVLGEASPPAGEALEGGENHEEEEEKEAQKVV
jgi:hypothetical protein